MKKIKAGIIGAAGYTAGELIRLLVNHPDVDISFLHSGSQAGKKVGEVHKDLFMFPQIRFNGDMEEADVYFLCKGHDESRKVLDRYPDLLKRKVIDLSQDFRIEGNHAFTYGLPEVNSRQIAVSEHVANPGCFATCIQLGILPVAEAGNLPDKIHISGLTGSTGAGQGLSATSHFSWRSNNASTYKILEHQHLLEISQTIAKYQEEPELNFIPYRGAFTRGIVTTVYFDTSFSAAELKEMYQAYYSYAAFSFVAEGDVDIKQVVNTNYSLISPTVIRGKAVIVSVIDNLLKGASGQAIQNMNIMFGLDETSGLKLKPGAY